MTERVILYVDGFNLYFGLKSKKWRRYYWLDLARLGQRLLKPGQALVAVKYFTARVSGNPNKAARQKAYLEALAQQPGLTIQYGQYLTTDRTCPKCQFVLRIPSEKMTDVNIATELLSDAFTNAVDTALLLSADSDLTSPVTVVTTRLHRRVIVVFPPDRHSQTLANVASASFTLGAALIRQSQLPETITKPDGYQIVRPPEWS